MLAFWQSLEETLFFLVCIDEPEEMFVDIDYSTFKC